MNNNRFAQLAVLFVAMLSLTCSAARAQETVPDLVRVPIFFVTDRNLQSQSSDANMFGPHRKYIGDCKHDPYMGTGYCVVENVGRKALTPQLTALGWKAADASEKVGANKINLQSGANFADIQASFYKNLGAQAKATDRKNIVLFAHGYKNSFEAAWKTAARFSYEFETPVVLYSWPSVSSLKSYTSDENNIEWSQEHFNDVLESLEGTCRDSSLRLRVYAHSMGSRLVIRATPYLRERPHILEVAVVCPDVDQGLVKHYARRYLSTKSNTKIRLYMSQRDKALALSQILHGGYCRLGECADSIAALAAAPFSTDKKGPSAKEQDRDLDERIARTKHRMQTIDFTNFDARGIGHRIPVGVITSMAYTDTPGPGYSLVSEKSGQRSRASRLLSKVTRLSKPDTIIPSENCLRLVKSDSAERALAKQGVAQ